jgi:hypothetical protein
VSPVKYLHSSQGNEPLGVVGSPSTVLHAAAEVIYRVTKCEIDLPTMRSDVSSEGQNQKKCRKVLNCVKKCDSFGHMTQNPKAAWCCAVATDRLTVVTRGYAAMVYPIPPLFHTRTCRTRSGVYHDSVPGLRDLGPHARPVW